MTAKEFKFRIVRYSDGQHSPSKGVNAGMFGVEQTEIRTVAFADDEAQALKVMRALKLAARADGHRVDDL